jgi:nitrogen fixation protein NifU and related proteins
MDELYKEHIIELSLRPVHYGTGGGVIVLHGSSPVCGDEITLHVTIESETITRASFVGECCALCTASTSLLLSHTIGKPVTEVQALLPADMYNILGITVAANRSGCVLLPYTTLFEYCKKANKDEPAEM